MIKLNLDTLIENIHGKPVLEADQKTLATLRYICVSALVEPVRASAEEKFWRAGLAARILRSDAAEIELEVEDVKRLKAIVGDGFPQPEIVFAAWQIFDDVMRLEAT